MFTMNVLIAIVIILVVAFVLDYVQGRIPMPAIGHTIARIIIWVVALIAILSQLGILGGMGVG